MFELTILGPESDKLCRTTGFFCFSESNNVFSCSGIPGPTGHGVTFLQLFWDLDWKAENCLVGSGLEGSGATVDFPWICEPNVAAPSFSSRAVL